MGIVYLVIIGYIIFNFFHDRIVSIQKYIKMKMKQNRVNGCDAVDLGLSVKWATCNIGAMHPEDYGNYFAWGEVMSKDKYDFDNYKYFDLEKDSYIFIGNNITGSRYDVARTILGDSWRMPTVDEFYDLINKCIWRWETVKGVVGYRIIGLNGNSIFLPAAGNSYSTEGDMSGFYWSGTLVDEEYIYDAFCLEFYDCNEFYVNYGNPIDGKTIRAVTEK